MALLLDQPTPPNQSIASSLLEESKMKYDVVVLIQLLLLLFLPLLPLLPLPSLL
jgi:hypothetical protein